MTGADEAWSVEEEHISETLDEMNDDSERISHLWACWGYAMAQSLGAVFYYFGKVVSGSGSRIKNSLLMLYTWLLYGLIGYMLVSLLWAIVDGIFARSRRSFGERVAMMVAVFTFLALVDVLIHFVAWGARKVRTGRPRVIVRTKP
jgi:hypothetical protein